MMACPEH